MVTALYFAFGSNMKTDRLRGRCPSATPSGAARLVGYELRFNKRSSKDGTGKANVVSTGHVASVVHGVLFELDLADLLKLDRVEGRGAGYERVEREVIRGDGSAVMAWTYLASNDAIDDRLRPTRLYLSYLVHGAREHSLPAAYVDALNAVEVAQ